MIYGHLIDLALDYNGQSCEAQLSAIFKNSFSLKQNSGSKITDIFYKDILNELIISFETHKNFTGKALKY